ncbi:MAG: chorismate-binding protein, partial [Chloroflexota bacterium]
MASNSDEVVLRDGKIGRWLRFRRPRRVLQTTESRDVMPLLEEVATRARVDGLYAAGFVSYEAAPGFDAALTVNDAGSFPLVWFGLYETPEVVEMGEQADAGSAADLDWRPSISQDAYRAAIGHIKEQIAAGRTYQVNYSLRLRAAFDHDPWAYFLQLVRAQEAPYGAYVDSGRYAICCASPELFFRLEDGRLTARPMKGTAPRGLTWAGDRAQAAWLQQSEKNRAENVMIVDMIRNDMGRVAQMGSVAAPQLFTVEKYP